MYIDRCHKIDGFKIEHRPIKNIVKESWKECFLYYVFGFLNAGEERKIDNILFNLISVLGYSLHGDKLDYKPYDEQLSISI